MNPRPVDERPDAVSRHPTESSEPTSPAPGLERYGQLAALLLVVVGLALRLQGLSEYWLNADEGIYYSTLTRSSFGAFWAEVMANAHPPAFYLLLRGLGYLTWDFVWLRGASVVFGVAAIWVFWLVGRELGGSGLRGAVSGVVAAAFLALNAEAVTLSQVIRPYTAVVFLLAASLLNFLRYRAEPNDRNLIAYAALLTAATFIHYSAALGLGVLSVLLVHDLLTRRLRGSAARKLVVAHAVPTLLFAGLYLVHIRTALGSDLMGQALGPGGWLSDWLVDSPHGAWRSLVAFQNFHLPPSFRVRVAFVLLAAIGVSALTRDRSVALLAGSALVIALAVSVLGVYPFGPSRHNAWLTVFTMPALGWLAGRLVTASRPRALFGSAMLLLLFLAGMPLERALGGPEARAVAVRTNATEERVIRRADLAPLVVDRMEPDGEPRTIVMTEQSYNVLMPLYSNDRDDIAFSADSTLFRFGYGTRQIVVVRTWDWSGALELTRRLDEIPEALPDIAWDARSPVLVLAGGWGSNLLTHIPGLAAEGVVTEQSWAVGRDATGRLIARMAAVVVDPQELAAR